MAISKSNIQFLEKLKENNNREWFAKNKHLYEEAYSNMSAFSEEVLNLLKKHDNIETLNGKKSLYRIYRDVRFSKDKSPYKSHWGSYYRRATSSLRGGYYLRISPNENNIVGCGFWSPNKEDLWHIRQQIVYDPETLRDIVNSKSFKETFGKLEGNQLKTAPKGFPKDHEAIELLRYKQFLVSKTFTDKEVLEVDFAQKVDEVFRKMRPFLDYMSNILTTDLNGELLDD